MSAFNAANLPHEAKKAAASPFFHPFICFALCVERSDHMHTTPTHPHARPLWVLRWQDGEEWGHLSVVTTPGARPEFVEFVHRDPAFFANLAGSSRRDDPDGFREAWFTSSALVGA
ncbi:hypothetical protein [Saccharopolyspora antimicrobica]|uniref:hypothetical protein n=1 Tax=Saccharopolyspora antimicrobica TaxID=455193 RepID=UPI0015A67DA0|nr:hypothetical protein [Saccharopolyspora antimicrobica]